MDTMSKKLLQNTEVKFKVKMIATIIPAAIFLITILIEGITGTGIQIMQNIYLISGLILLVATGAVVKLLKIALTAFKWGWLLTPFTLFPFGPMALDTWDLYMERRNAKAYL